MACRTRRGCGTCAVIVRSRSDGRRHLAPATRRLCAVPTRKFMGVPAAGPSAVGLVMPCTASSGDTSPRDGSVRTSSDADSTQHRQPCRHARSRRAESPTAALIVLRARGISGPRDVLHAVDAGGAGSPCPMVSRWSCEDGYHSAVASELSPGKSLGQRTLPQHGGFIVAFLQPGAQSMPTMASRPSRCGRY